MFRRRMAPKTPAFNPYQRQTYHIDVYDKGQASFRFTAVSGEPWVVVTPSSGLVRTQTRLSVHVNWNAAPVGENQQVPITITGPDTSKVVVQAVVDNPASPKPDAVSGFVEGDGYVAMEAPHYTAAVATAPVSWVTIPDLGRTLSGVMAEPVKMPSVTPGGDSPHLEYKVFMFDTGTVNVHAYVSPTLNFENSPNGLRYAVSFDDQAPVMVNIQADTTDRAWSQHVSDAIITPVTPLHLDTPGEHVLKFWLVDPGVVLQRLVIAPDELPPSYLGPPESFHRSAR
jgi:Gylcosyl hydrolase family 115 C-terminal domain